MNPLEFSLIRYPEEYRYTIYNTIIKCYKYFNTHENILVSISGGSDSDICLHIICKYFPEIVSKCHFVFVDTGLEFEATRRHIAELSVKYGVEIETIRGKSVVYAVKEYGIPILNKEKIRMD